MVAALVAGGVAWAVCGGLTLNDTYPLGVDLSGDGWFYFDVPLAHDSAGLLKWAKVASESNNVGAAYVKCDGGSWVDLWGYDYQPYYVAAGNQVWHFKFQPANVAVQRANLCVYIEPSGESKRHFGVQGCVW